jgi:hypothetical protein
MWRSHRRTISCTGGLPKQEADEDVLEIRSFECQKCGHQTQRIIKA